MSEPKRRAAQFEQLIPGVLHWSVFDDRISYRSDAYALTTDEGMVLIDPLPLTGDALACLAEPGPGSVVAIILTIQSHQRAAWRYRRHFATKVYAPRRAAGLEEQPDVWYGEGDELPLGLRALHAPGPTDASEVLVYEAGSLAVVWLGDLLMRTDQGSFAFVPSEYMDAPALARDSVRGLYARLEHRSIVLCPGHGAPLISGGAHALEQALARDTGP